jgi:hypothetical protein
MKVFFQNWRNHINSASVPSFRAKMDLNREFWGREDLLDQKIKENLLQIAKDFMERSEVSNVPIKDMTFTGSLANYNYSKYSDIDLHIIIDFDDVDENSDLVKEFFDFKRALWNQNHKILINGYEVEIYVQDVKEPHVSTGVYSVLDDQWLTKPDREETDIDYDNIKKKSKSLIDEIDDIERIEEIDVGVLEKKLNKINRLREKIRKFRKIGLETDGEYSIENLTFKVLRRNGYLKKLSDLKKNTYDEMMSLEEQL